MKTRTIRITHDQNKLMRSLLDSHMGALKNWAASAIEHDEVDRAKGIVAELRFAESLCHTFVPAELFADRADV